MMRNDRVSQHKERAVGAVTELGRDIVGQFSLKKKAKDWLKNLVKTGVILLATKALGGIALLAAATGVAVPVVWVVLGIILFIGILIYNRKKIIKVKEVADYSTQITRELRRSIKSKNVLKALNSLDPSHKNCVDGIKKIKKDIDSIYQQASELFGVDVKEMEMACRDDNLQANVREVMEEEYEFLTNLMKLLNKDTTLMTSLSKEQQKTLEELKQKLDTGGNNVQLREGASPFTNVSFKPGDEFCKQVKENVHDINYYAESPSDRSKITFVQSEGALGNGEMAIDTLLNLGVLSINTLVMYKAILSDELNYFLPKNSAISLEDLGKARRLIDIFSPNFSSRKRCGALCTEIYGVARVSDDEYQELFAMLNIMTLGNIQDCVHMQDDLSEGKGVVLKNVIDRYSYEGINLEEALSIVRNAPVIANKNLSFEAPKEAATLSSRAPIYEDDIDNLKPNPDPKPSPNSCSTPGRRP